MEFPRTFGSKLKNTLQPTNTEIVPIRPLNFGADTVHPRSLVKLRSLENLYASDDGWHLRPALETRMGTVPLASGEHILDYVNMSFTGGSIAGSAGGYGTFIAIGSMYLYWTNDGITWERSCWKKDYYVAGSDPSGDLTIDATAPDNFVTDKILGSSAMFVAFQDANGDYSIIRNIASVAAAQLTLTAALPAGIPSPYHFKIFYAFRAVDPYIVQWTQAPDAMYLVDTSSAGIMSYDGKYLSSLAIHKESAGATLFSAAASIIFTDGRIVVGNLGEASGYRIIRWSLVTDITEFQTNNYVVLAQSNGAIHSLKLIENYIVASTFDDIYVGKPFTGNLSFTMPWVFKRLESSGRVPVSQSAIISALNAIFYIGADDVYTLSFKQLNAEGDFVITPLGCTLRNQFLNSGSDLSKARILYEPVTENVLISTSVPFSTLWVFNVRTSSWAKWTFPVSMDSMARSIFAPMATYATILALYPPVTYGNVPCATITIDATGFAAGETVTVGTVTYNLVAAIGGGSVENDVEVGTTPYDTLVNIQNAILADSDTFETTHHCAIANPDAYAVAGGAGYHTFLYLIGFVPAATIPLATTCAHATLSGATFTQNFALYADSTYQSLLLSSGTSYLLFSTASGVQYAFNFSGYLDFGTTHLEPFFETGDMDFDAPDDEKVIYRLGILSEGSFDFSLEGSTDRGRTWKVLTPLLHTENGEEEVHFRLSGDKLSIRCSILTLYSAVTIEGLTMALKITGENVIRGGN